MQWKTGMSALGLLAATSFVSPPAMAADHRDGAAVLADPTTDINDVYAWMSTDKNTVYLAMTVNPLLGAAGGKFSDQSYYVFHTNSRPALLLPAGNVSADIICSFDTAQNISCWVDKDPATGKAQEFIYGDAAAVSAKTGVTGPKGTKVYAGLRNDPFFFNLGGFNDFRAFVKANAAGLTLDAAKCPTLAGANLTAAQNRLKGTNNGAAAAVDTFTGKNTLAIVLAVPTTLIAKGGTTLGVWASTNKKN